jgi:hypothetical protein
VYSPPNDIIGLLPLSLSALNATGATLNNLDGRSTMTWSVIGTFVATMMPEVTLDGINFFTLPTNTSFINLSTMQMQTGGITAPGLYQFSLAGIQMARLKMVAFTSGSAGIGGRGSFAPAVQLPQGNQVLPNGMRGRQSWCATFNNVNLPSGGTGAFSDRIVDAVSAGTGATYTVPASKILRITSGRLSWLGGSTQTANTSQYAYGMASLKAANGAAPISGSPSVVIMPFAAPTIGQNVVGSDIAGLCAPFDFPDGTLDLPAGWQISLWGENMFSNVILWGSINGYLYNQG